MVKCVIVSGVTMSGAMVRFVMLSGASSYEPESVLGNEDLGT